MSDAPWCMTGIARAILGTILWLNVTGGISSCLERSGDDASRLEDLDGNGVPDALEMRLANQFAPIVFYYPDEPNLPTRVDRFLRTTQLWFFSEYCSPLQAAMGPTPGEIPRMTAPSCRVPGEVIDSHGTRSAGKSSTFYLKSVSRAGQRGSAGDPQDWVTYVHSYVNDAGGVTLQYWRFYPFNTAYVWGFHVEGGDHGGDWEAIHVVLGPGPAYTPLQIRLLGHREIQTEPWSRVIHEGSHPLILCARGGHTSEVLTPGQFAKRSQLIEHQSWNGGMVRWPGRPGTPYGTLALIGQKTRPMPGMEWIQYSGLWGDREKPGMLSWYRSGYWGPAFNETGMRNGFIAAWCEGMASTSPIPVPQECYASAALP